MGPLASVSSSARVSVKIALREVSNAELQRDGNTAPVPRPQQLLSLYVRHRFGNLDDFVVHILVLEVGVGTKVLVTTQSITDLGVMLVTARAREQEGVTIPSLLHMRSIRW